MTSKNQNPDNICLIATDVKALFPSLEAGESERICKIMIKDGDMSFKGINLAETLLYLRLNK